MGINRKMSKLVHLILVMTLVSQCQSFCGEEDDPTRVPRVKVANSTHLRVSWYGLFAGCYSQDIENMVAVAEHTTQHTASQKTITVEFGEREASLQLDPCLQYKIYLRIFSHSGDRTYRESKIIKYNDISQQNDEHFYGGMLKDFMNKICLKRERVIRIPDPPEALSECILTKGDQDIYEFTAPGQSHFIPLQILNPTNREPLKITAMVNRIKQCVPTSTPTTTSPSDIIPKLGGPQSVIIFTISILGTTLVVALITATVCWFKKRKRTVVVQLEKDFNPMYGTVYYHLDRAVATDENGYYGGNIEKEGGDQERITDNNSVYSRE